MDAQADLPRLVCELMERMGLSQERFAARFGVTYATINRWENGRDKPSPLVLRQIEGLVQDMGERGKDLLQEFSHGQES